MQRARNGQHRSDSQWGGADLATLHALLGHYARLYWDLQAARIAIGNRVGALERAEIHTQYAAPALDIETGLEAIEAKIQRQLRALVRQHFMRDWVDAQRGLGDLGFACILGVTGSLDRFPSVAKLWKYLGLHVQDGAAPRRQKGVPWTHTDCQFGHLAACKPGCTTDHHSACVPGGVGTAYSPKGRVICHQIGEAIVKVGAGGLYRAAYDRKKEQYELDRPDWMQARRHNAAMRYAVKLLVKEMWLEWRRRVRAPAA